MGGNNILRMPVGTGGSTFGGSGLEIAQGTVGLMKNTRVSTAIVTGQFTLDGGTLIYGPDGSSTSNHEGGLAIAFGFIVLGDSDIQIGNAGGHLRITGALEGFRPRLHGVHRPVRLGERA